MLPTSPTDPSAPRHVSSRFPRRKLVAWIVFFTATAGSIIGSVILYPWAAKCMKEAANCDRLAREWEDTAKGLLTVGDIYASRIGTKPNQAAWLRGQSARSRYLSERARLIAGLYHRQAEQWRRWRAPSDQVDLVSLWREPEVSDLARFAPP